MSSWLPLHVALECLLSDLSSINHSVRIDGNTFRRACAESFSARIGFGIGNKSGELAILRAADANAALPLGPLRCNRSGLRIRNINHVVLVDRDAARPAELMPLGDELAVLIENLNAIVRAIANEQASLRIHRQRMRLIELDRACSLLAKLLQEFAGFVEHQNPRVGSGR